MAWIKITEPHELGNPNMHYRDVKDSDQNEASCVYVYAYSICTTV